MAKDAYDYLKTAFAITDNPVLIQSKLEKLRQDSKSIAGFTKEFYIKLNELRMSQTDTPLTESYMLSAFKGCLHERYRLFADEQFSLKTLSQLVDALLIWEQNSVSA